MRQNNGQLMRLYNRFCRDISVAIIAFPKMTTDIQMGKKVTKSTLRRMIFSQRKSFQMLRSEANCPMCGQFRDRAQDRLRERASDRVKPLGECPRAYKVRFANEKVGLPQIFCAAKDLWEKRVRVYVLPTTPVGFRHTPELRNCQYAGNSVTERRIDCARGQAIE